MASKTCPPSSEKMRGVDTLTISEPAPSLNRSGQSNENVAPPRDHGRAAWTCLAAVSAISMATWGFGASQGVFREYYFKNVPFKGNQLVASIGLLVVGILQSLSPFLLHFIGNFPHYRLHMMWTGMILVVASSLGAAFSTTALQVIMTQGLMYGFSSGLLFAPCISFVDEWFFQRRGLANGILGLPNERSFGSANIASAGLSPIFALLLRRFGPRTTLIGWTVFIAIVISLGIFFVRSRTTLETITGTGMHRQKPSLRPLRSPLLWLFVISMALQSLANNLPANYLPSYATDLGVSPNNAALLVTYLSLSGIIGQASLGALTDKTGPLIPMLLSTLVSSFSVLVVWGLGKSYWAMVIVSLLFGAFAFSFVVLRSHMAAIVVNNSERPAEELLVSGILLFTRGVIGVVSGYIAAAVLQSSEGLGVQTGYGAGKWRPFIVLLGTTMTAATVGMCGLLKKSTR